MYVYKKLHVYIYVYVYLDLSVWVPNGCERVSIPSLTVWFVWHPLEGAGIKNIVGYHRLSRWWLIIVFFFEIRPYWYLGK